MTRGAARREQRAWELATFQAYQAERFARAGKRLRPLGHYLAELRRKPGGAAELLAGFEAMKARGLPVEIRRVGAPAGERKE